MASMNVYNYYHMAMPHIANTKYDSHKKGELKSLYQDMVRLNKKQPFFKLSLSNSTQNYVIGIKEAALELKTSSAFLTEDIDPAHRKMSVQTDKPGDISVSLITDDYDSLPSDFQVQVDTLARTQKNEGLPLETDGKDLEPGKHLINIDHNGTSYQFEIETHPDETNLHAARRLSMSINNSNIGIRSQILESGTKFSMNLESKSTGAGTLEDGIQFSITGTNDGGLVDTLGLNRIAQRPVNAEFAINGEAQSSASNHISINNQIGIDLRKTTDGEATVKISTDQTGILEDVDDFVNYYNHLIDLANEQPENTHGARKLLREIKSVANHFENTLESSGLKLTEDGHLEKDEALLVQSTEQGNVHELFNQLSDFRSAIETATERITLNPMEYVDKTIVSYPNVKQTFPNPYMPSIYSGMLYNQYV